MGSKGNRIDLKNSPYEAEIKDLKRKPDKCTRQL